MLQGEMWGWTHPYWKRPHWCSSEKVARHDVARFPKRILVKAVWKEESSEGEQ